MRLFLLGSLNRQTAATMLNQHSSRSHSVFTIKVVSYQSTVDLTLDAAHLRVSQLSIVDLAGVERTKRTQVTGQTMAEASNINKSLLTLRNCFDAMRHNQQAQQSANPRPRLVPFRQHKLTHLLKSFFEHGRAHIRMLVCVKPTVEDFDDNVQILSFGRKAQEILIEHPSQNVTDQEMGSFDASTHKERKDKSRSSRSSVDLLELTLARCQYKPERLSSATFDGFQFASEVDDFLEAAQSAHSKVTDAIQKTSKLQTVGTS